jgi:hypothetical protein
VKVERFLRERLSDKVLALSSRSFATTTAT